MLRVIAAVGCVLAAALVTGPAAVADATPPLTCSSHDLPVAIADPGPTDQHLSGELCFRGRIEPRSVQLLVPGASYNRAYWTLPAGPRHRSYVDAATSAGFATFVVDRVGTGRSSHPDGAALTVDAGAVALHDAVSALHRGAVDGHRFDRVTWVGHSFGSFYGWTEIARYHDVDAAIFTGALHVIGAAAESALVADTYPAAQDPRFAGTIADPNYFTTRPGTRSALFYAPATTDPRVLATDEATKDIVTAGELGYLGTTFPLAPERAPTARISVPVLLVDGAEDNVFCGVSAYDCTDPASVRRFESAYYPHASLRVVTVPRTGHDLALSTTAPVADAAMIAWSLAQDSR